MIQLTAALPMYNAGPIAWLQMEGLCRQVSVSFKWELIIAEEQNGHEFGEDRVNSYRDRLFQKGCKEIKYVPMKEWIPLAMKWRRLAIDSDCKSSAFACFAADNFTHPIRLAEAYRAIVGLGVEYVSYDRVPFYVIPTQEVYLADYSRLAQTTGIERPAGMQFSIAMALAKQLPVSSRARGVDGWIYRALPEIKGDAIKCLRIRNNWWTKGFHTHGMGSISQKRLNLLPERYVRDDTLIQQWPEEIMLKLGNLKGEKTLENQD